MSNKKKQEDNSLWEEYKEGEGCHRLGGGTRLSTINMILDNSSSSICCEHNLVSLVWVGEAGRFPGDPDMSKVEYQCNAIGGISWRWKDNEILWRSSANALMASKAFVIEPGGGGPQGPQCVRWITDKDKKGTESLSTSLQLMQKSRLTNTPPAVFWALRQDNPL